MDSENQDSKKYEILAKVLWLADLSVTYMSSDPLNIWNRVINLYDELYLPKHKIISQTDLFFSQFINDDIFKLLISNKSFPSIFKTRWRIVKKFYNDGNPATIINRTMDEVKKSYSKFNLEIGIKTWSTLYNMAINNPSEYFIGIGNNFDAVYSIKHRFAVLNTKNTCCFLGKLDNMLPHVRKGSVDNIFYIINAKDKDYTLYKTEISNIFRYASKILKQNGSFQIFIEFPDRKHELDYEDKSYENLLNEISFLADSFNFNQIQNNMNYNDYYFVLNKQDNTNNNYDNSFLLKFKYNHK